MTSFLRGSCPHLRHPGPVNFPRARSRGRRVPLRVALAPQDRVGVPVRRANLENEPTRRPSLRVHVHTSRRVTGAAALSGALCSHAEHPATADYSLEQDRGEGKKSCSDRCNRCRRTTSRGCRGSPARSRRRRRSKHRRPIRRPTATTRRHLPKIAGGGSTVASLSTRKPSSPTCHETASPVFSLSARAAASPCFQFRSQTESNRAIRRRAQ